MEAKDKAYLKELADAVEQHLLGQVQVTPETRRQAAVIEAMRYSLEAGENVFVRFWFWNSAESAAEPRSRPWLLPVPLR